MSEIDDPFSHPDATVIRPRPGAGRPGAATGGRMPSPLAPPPVMVADPEPAAPRAWTGDGLGPLLQAASPLLHLAGRLRVTPAMPDPDGLKRQALDEIRRFEDRARAAGVPNEMVVTGRYALCASLDEAVLSTPWGAQSTWGQQTLLVLLHGEASGGEKFFDVLDRLAADPARYIDLLELQSLCLAFGFTGKYRLMERGDARLAEIQQQISRLVRTHRGAPPADLALRWRGVEDRRNPIVRYVPWWVAGAAALVVVTVAFTVAATALSRAAAPVHEGLLGVGFYDRAAVPIDPPSAGPSLAALLAPEAARGAIDVREDGAGRTTVTLTAPTLFASSSAVVNAEHRPALLRVAAALDQVPGRVVVVGHTDGQPLRSLRFRDNFDLSRERAVSVAATLQEGLALGGRIEVRGVGSTEPLVDPEIDAESRARNRRVEIIHDAGA